MSSEAVEVIWDKTLQIDVFPLSICPNTPILTFKGNYFLLSMLNKLNKMEVFKKHPKMCLAAFAGVGCALTVGYISYSKCALKCSGK